MADQQRESARVGRPVQGDLYAPYGPEDGWMFRADPDAVEEQGARFGRAIKNGIKALRHDGKKVYAEDLGARPRSIPAAPPMFDGLGPSPDYQQFQQEYQQVPVPQVVGGLVDQHGRLYDPRREHAPPRPEPRPTDFEPFDAQKAWEAEMRRAEAAVRGEPLPPEPEPPVNYRLTTNVSPTQLHPEYPPEAPQYPGYPTEQDRRPPQAPPAPTSEMRPQAVSPTYPEFLNADGTVPRRPCGATTVITLRNRDHVIECQEEIRDSQNAHPHYGLPHLALVTTGKRGHRVFIGWHEEE